MNSRSSSGINSVMSVYRLAFTIKPPVLETVSRPCQQHTRLNIPLILGKADVLEFRVGDQLAGDFEKDKFFRFIAVEII